MSNFNVEERLQYIRDNATAHATALSNREHLKEFRKSKKAMLVNEAELNGIKGAQAREAYAYSHKEYIDLLEGLKVAIFEECRIRQLIKAAELGIEVWRSTNARQKAEMSAYNSKGSM